jgi:hypothetical protein
MPALVSVSNEELSFCSYMELLRTILTALLNFYFYYRHNYNQHTAILIGYHEKEFMDVSVSRQILHQSCTNSITYFT